MGNVYHKQINADQYGLWKKGKPALTHLDIELTERCNNNCIHCYINLPQKDASAENKEIPYDQVIHILKQAAELGCLSVRFTGGEPLIRKDFEKIYVYARKLGLRVNIFTNATLLSPELVELFTRIPPLEKIEITVYGMSEESYESIARIPGSFDAAMKGIHLLQTNKIPLELKSVYLPKNRNEVEQFENWAISVMGKANKPTVTHLLDLRCRRDSEEMNDRIRKLRISPEGALEFVIRDPGAYREENRQFLNRFSKIPGDILFPCSPGRDSGCVDAYGNFLLCMQLKHPDTIYDLKTGTLQEAIKEFSPAIINMKAENPEYLTRCGNCFLYGFCEQCPAESWMEHGTLDSPVDYFCGITHIQARWLGVLSRSEKSWEVENWEDRIKKL